MFSPHYARRCCDKDVVLADLGRLVDENLREHVQNFHGWPGWDAVSWPRCIQLHAPIEIARELAERYAYVGWVARADEHPPTYFRGREVWISISPPAWAIAEDRQETP